jgi:hypothetical protein
LVLDDDKENTVRPSAFSQFKKEQKVQFAAFPEISTFQKEMTNEEILHECSFCHKLSSKTKILNGCSHYIHLGCLKMKTISMLMIGKFKIFCPNKDCTAQIDRDKIVRVLDDRSKIIYDTLNFIREYSIAEPDKVLYWCHRCRLID